MTRAKLAQWLASFDQRRTVVALGSIHFDELRCEVLSSVAELVPCRPGEFGCDVVHVLGNLGVQSFFYSGHWIVRIDSDLTAGPYFL
jgi:hypothetical protein